MTTEKREPAKCQDWCGDERPPCVSHRGAPPVCHADHRDQKACRCTPACARERRRVGDGPAGEVACKCGHSKSTHSLGHCEATGCACAGFVPRAPAATVEGPRPLTETECQCVGKFSLAHLRAMHEAGLHAPHLEPNCPACAAPPVAEPPAAPVREPGELKPDGKLTMGQASMYVTGACEYKGPTDAEWKPFDPSVPVAPNISVNWRFRLKPPAPKPGRVAEMVTKWYAGPTKGTEHEIRALASDVAREALACVRRLGSGHAWLDELVDAAERELLGTEAGK